MDKGDKIYGLCGLGNGLTDVLIHISEEDFAALDFEKGGMVLVDDDAQRQLLDRFSSSKATLVSGGSVANSTIVFSQLGGKAAYLSRLGNDQYGKHYREEFQELGVSLGNELVDGENAGTCLVLITPDAERTMRTNLGSCNRLGEQDLNKELIKQSRWLLIEGYVFGNSTESLNAIKDAVRVAKEYETRIAVSFSDLFVVQGFSTELHEVVESIDLIFANETEASAFTNTNSAEAAIDYFEGQRKNSVVTAGAKGSYIYYEGEKVFVPAVACNPVDLTGAGDMFAGVLMYGLVNGINLDLSARAANLLASMVISKVGARLGGGVKEAWAGLVE